MSGTKNALDTRCQLQRYIDEHGSELILRGKAYRFENIRLEKGLAGFADALTVRAKYLAKQIGGNVIGRPGAEPWVIMRTTGGGATLAKFALHNGMVVELI